MTCPGPAGPLSGACEVEFDRGGRLWVEQYLAGRFARMDPGTGHFTEFRTPMPLSVPGGEEIGQEHLARRIVFHAEMIDDLFDGAVAVAVDDDFAGRVVQLQDALGIKEHFVAGDGIGLQPHARRERRTRGERDRAGLRRFHTAGRWHRAAPRGHRI